MIEVTYNKHGKITGICSDLDLDHISVTEEEFAAFAMDADAYRVDVNTKTLYANASLVSTAPLLDPVKVQAALDKTCDKFYVDELDAWLTLSGAMGVMLNQALNALKYVDTDCPILAMRDSVLCVVVLSNHNVKHVAQAILNHINTCMEPICNDEAN